MVAESNDEGDNINSGSKYNCVVTFYHDVEQNMDSSSNVDKCRYALNEALKIEKKNGITATYNVVGKLFMEQPDIIDRIVKSGSEVAFHSFNHQNDWKPSFFYDEVKLCREMSSLPVGYRSPRSQWNLSTLNALMKYNFIWTAENDLHGEPYLIRDKLMRLPISQDDWFL
ncbi:MAG: polysaccharide deacetylase family protein, partial [Candidatus Hodarchaeales archaeon]